MCRKKKRLLWRSLSKLFRVVEFICASLRLHFQVHPHWCGETGVPACDGAPALSFERLLRIIPTGVGKQVYHLAMVLPVLSFERLLQIIPTCVGKWAETVSMLRPSSLGSIDESSIGFAVTAQLGWQYTPKKQQRKKIKNYFCSQSALQICRAPPADLRASWVGSLDAHESQRRSAAQLPLAHTLGSLMDTKRCLFSEISEGLQALSDAREGRCTVSSNEKRLSKRLRRATAEEVKALREGLNLSKAMFARQLGTNTGTLESWEKGCTQPNGQASLLIDLIKRYPDTVLRLQALC